MSHGNRDVQGLIAVRRQSHIVADVLVERRAVVGDNQV